MRSRLLLLAALTCLPASARGEDKKALAQQARAILQAHCYRCHGEQGTVEGGVNYLLDRERLVARKKLVPGDPVKSKLIKRISAGEMPPEDEKKRPSGAELAVLKQWVAAGAPDFNPATARRDLIGNVNLLEIIDKDLAALPAKDRRLTRYFTIAHLYNAGLSEDELETYRHAIAKLLNSLSWGNRIAVPVAVDPARTVLRIDLRKYKWTDATWSSLQAHYPYGILLSSDLERRCQTAAKARLPYLRGDWFVAVAALPPLYHDLLGLPRTDRELEKQLHVNLEENLKSGQALRAGFNGSGISRNNRLIERHQTLFGGYWKSYDFASNTARQNLFAMPLGPDANRPTGFLHDGGEIIFSLPNGLQGYMLIDSRGQRIDKGPAEIVSDPRRPDRAVVNGLSCMACHARGIISKDDQVRAHVEKNRQAFLKEEVGKILALYPPRQKMQEAMDEDAERFRKAAEKTGCRPGTTEPITALTQRFEAEADLPLAAAELGLSAAALRTRFAQSLTLSRTLGPLAIEEGTVQRDVLTEAFPAVVRDLELGTVEPVRDRGRFRWSSSDRPAWQPSNPPVVPPVPEPKISQQSWRGFFHGARYETPWLHHIGRHQTGELQALALSPRDRWTMALESRIGVITVEDRKHQVTTAHLEGHKGNVLCLDFAPDARLLASGSMDQTARIWDLETSEERHLLAGHAGFVSAVRFSPDGKSLATGSERVRLWDVSSGREHTVFDKAAGWVESLSFAPDGKVLATGGKAVQLWDAATGKILATLGNETGARAVAFSPDGLSLACGQANGAIAIWDVAGRKVRRTLTGHRQAVSSLAYAPNGKLLVSGAGGQSKENEEGEYRAWDPETGKELAAQAGHRRGITCVAAAHDGKFAATIGLDGHVCFRDLMSLGRVSLEPFEGHTATLTSVILSPDGKRALSGSIDHTARLWDMETGKQLLVLDGDKRAVLSVQLSPDRRTGYTSGADKTVRRWNLTTGKATHTWELPLSAVQLELSADGKTLAAAASSFVRVFDPATGQVRRELKQAVRSFSLSSDGRRLAGRSGSGPIRIWDLTAGKQLVIMTASKGYCWATAFSPDDKFLVAAVDKKVILYDAETGKEVRSYDGPAGSVRSVQFCDRGRKVLASSEEGGKSKPDGGTRGAGSTVFLWDRETGRVVKRWHTRPLAVLHLAACQQTQAVLFATRLELTKVSIGSDPP